MIRRCEFSPDRRYRYSLWREADLLNAEDSIVQFICLNPSTADEYFNDPTVRRCVSYAVRWGYRWICITNLFAYRATDPRDMMAQDDPEGPMNMRWIRSVADEADTIVVAWGSGGMYRDQWLKVADLLKDKHLVCLGVTRKGQPKHPLYLRNDAPFIQWEGERGEDAEE